VHTRGARYDARLERPLLLRVLNRSNKSNVQIASEVMPPRSANHRHHRTHCTLNAAPHETVFARR